MKCQRFNISFAGLVLVLIWGLAGCALPVMESSNLNKLDSQTLYQEKLNNKLIYFLPKGLVKLKYTKEKTMTADIIYFPDPGHPYLLTYHTIPWYKDDVTIAVSKEGLLTSVNVTTTNQAADIIGKAMEIAKTVISPVQKGLAASEEFELIVDPPNVDPEKPANDIVIYSKAGEKMGTVHFERLLKRALPDSETLKGVCFRPGLPCKMTITLSDASFDFMIMLPNWSPVISIDITRAFAERTQQLTFTEGMLTNVQWKQTSSELLAILSIPAETAKGLAGLPIDLFKFQVNSGNK